MGRVAVDNLGLMNSCIDSVAGGVPFAESGRRTNRNSHHRYGAQLLYLDGLIKGTPWAIGQHGKSQTLSPPELSHSASVACIETSFFRKLQDHFLRPKTMLGTLVLKGNLGSVLFLYISPVSPVRVLIQNDVG